MKRVVLLTWKDKSKGSQIYKTATELVKKNDVGITLASLWNALARNGGRYENNICIIEYKGL